MISAMSITVRVGLSALEAFGVTIDATLKATVNMMLSLATQLALAAISYAAHPLMAAFSAALAVLAAEMHRKAIQLQAEGATEAKQEMENSRRLMSEVSQSLIIISRVV